MKKINIAIDGPSAAGKSSVANTLARELSYIHIDTGSMYRATAYLAQKYGMSLDDEEGIAKLLNEKPMEINEDGSIFVDNETLTKQLFGNEISLAASNVSKLAKVRTNLVSKQQQIAKKKGFILDGRDIGTVVLPDAEVKIYLTASAEARAKRRTLQNIAKGLSANYEEILAEIQKRDYQDMNRENSPLRCADDAIVIDSSDLSLEEVVSQILEIVQEKE